MHALAFADSTRPPRTVILRLPLLDYSIGHELLLIQQRNPLVLLNPVEFDKLPALEQKQAVIRAVLVCNRNWEDNRKPSRWMRLWRWKNANANYAAAIADFRNYRAEGTTFPICNPPEGKSREMGSPFLARLIHIAGFNLDLPLGALQWAYFAQAEAEGRVSVENDTDRQISDEIAQAQADYEREQKEKQCPAS